jgi:DNA helicase-2/ATP-dependent DNA helicase PcrA
VGVDFSRLLNSEQLRAVESLQGPLLILAGAGSGKTRVIAYRIARLLSRGQAQASILAVTFTNKAAREMAHRVRELAGRPLPRLIVSTFHAFGVRVLRQDGEALGYRPNFSIYDESDRESLLKECARDLGFGRDLDLYAVVGLFSRLKSQLAGWQEEGESAGIPAQERLRPLFKEYQARLRLHNAVDFDDLIRLPIELLEGRPEILARYRERFRHFLVDEFQDTSLQQYRLIRLLAQESRNLCVVGGDDQSIYSWRGANFENLRLFEQDFPGYGEIKLEQNYRSTARILAAANGLILHNQERKPKTLWSSLGEGEPVTVVIPEDETQEGEYIAGSIRAAALRRRVPFSQFGVLVRTNSLTRALEEAFVRENLPYAVSGGLSFFQRAEVKDLLAYLRVLANPDDEVSLVRILNTPRRGIGRRTLEAAVETARARSCSLFGALNLLSEREAGPGLAEKACQPIGEFLELLEEFRDRFHKGKKQMAAALRNLVERIDYWGHLVQDNPKGPVARWKLANVESLVDSLAAYEQDPDNLDPSLYQYLNRVTLMTREDNQDEYGQQKVQLMTIHAAKGLEFDTVFVAAVEKDLIPHARSVEEGEANLEEERRLFYVALTRAKRHLTLSMCRARRRRGELRGAEPSPFLEELPREMLEFRELEEKALEPEDAARLFARMKEGLGRPGPS